jgi:hydrogenase nickel incorporation protein HypA/HybF
MHELAIAESIIDTVLQHVPARQIGVVHVRIGKLTAVVPEALQFCFDLATTGTSLEGCRLHVELADARAHCRSCDADFVLGDLVLLCACGSADVDILAGRELQVASVEAQ